MSANSSNSKPLTPAQTAKPLGSSIKTASGAAAKKTETLASETATKDDTAKAVEKLQTQTKAVYGFSILRRSKERTAVG